MQRVVLKMNVEQLVGERFVVGADRELTKKGWSALALVEPLDDRCGLGDFAEDVQER